jgi:5-methylcytosine-specific restriction endonuclease McrA
MCGFLFGENELKKVCSVCGQEKELTEYNKQKAGKYGVRANCRDCQKKAQHTYKQTEKAKEKNREWKKTAKGKECAKRYRENNKEKFSEYRKTDDYRRRHRKSADNQRFGGNRLKALERDNYTCVLCGSTENIQVHHIDENGRNKPKEEQNNDLSNLTTLCGSCHIKQHNPVFVRWGKREVMPNVRDRA